MNSPRNIVRLIAGLTVWVLAIGWLVYRTLPAFSGAKDGVGNQLATFALERRSTWELKFADDYVVRIGDPVFWRDEQGELVQIGAIRQIESPDSTDYQARVTDWASVTLFASAPPIADDSYLVLYETPSSMSWVAQSLFPEHKRDEIARLITRAFKNNTGLIVNELKPILLRAISQTSSVVRDELTRSIVAHADDWQALGRRYQEEIVNSRLMPVLNEEVWPVVQEEFQPVLKKIGSEIWNQASVWRFGWRAVYDSMPMTSGNLAQREFTRFVETGVLPTVRNHMPELLAAQRNVLTRVAENPRVQAFIDETFHQLAGDTELQALVMTIVSEAVLENDQFHQQIESIWQSPEVVRVLRFSDSRFGPEIEKIGETIFGSPITGVTPEFARVLRHRILLKDMRWLVLTQDPSLIPNPPPAADRKSTKTLPLVFGDSTDDNPFFIEATSRK